MKNIIDAIKAKKANNKLIDTNFAIIASKGGGYQNTLATEFKNVAEQKFISPHYRTTKVIESSLVAIITGKYDSEWKEEYKKIIHAKDDTGIIGYVLNRAIAGWIYCKLNKFSDIHVVTYEMEAIAITCNRFYISELIVSKHPKEMTIDMAMDIYQNKDKDGKYFNTGTYGNIQKFIDYLSERIELAEKSRVIAGKQIELVTYLENLKKINNNIANNFTDDNKSVQAKMLAVLDSIRTKIVENL